MDIFIPAVVLTFALLGVLGYNRLARLRLLADNAWSDIDVQLKRRHDLVPSLVSAVKGHAEYERGTLEEVVRARNQAQSATGPASSAQAEAELARGVQKLLLLAEAYPDLKAAASYLALQHDLTDLEDHIQHARRYYNAVVRDYNTRIAQFPSNLIANTFGFGSREFFGIEDDAERAVPSVDTR
jgi:LemA protein